jgi:hypothetical protein
MWGGIAQAAYDPCYHQACDTVANINQEVRFYFFRTLLCECMLKATKLPKKKN